MDESEYSLLLPWSTLDERIQSRGLIERLRRDPRIRILERQALDDRHYLVRFTIPTSVVPSTVISWQDEWEYRTRLTPERVAVPVPPTDQPNRNGDVLSPEVRERIITQYINHQEGREALAQRLVPQLLDYTSIGRRAFIVQELPPGALPIYDKDVSMSTVTEREEVRPEGEPFWDRLLMDSSWV